jgi:hypothetical protein
MKVIDTLLKETDIINVAKELRELGAKVRVNGRRLVKRKKTYLHIEMEGGHHEWLKIVMPIIHKRFPDAYMTSGGFSRMSSGAVKPQLMNVTIALER